MLALSNLFLLSNHGITLYACKNVWCFLRGAQSWARDWGRWRGRQAVMVLTVSHGCVAFSYKKYIVVNF